MATVLVALAALVLFAGLSILIGKAHRAEMLVEPGSRRARRLAGKLAARLGLTAGGAPAGAPVVAVDGVVDGVRVEIVVADRSVVVHVGSGPAMRTLTADPAERVEALEARVRAAIGARAEPVG